ncbi:rho family-interacting cell polarization regulator 1-like [Eriocheir sinensis]|uniref:rho family-interacting cell polarization regulator 1-like n=1 Tax=Eriocheir sinensis TaxID=95602 RepID=UPI0021C7C3DB|nr:rho family-interacting cell polarization regulator 1-like [Eriocheir sinensis]
MPAAASSPHSQHRHPLSTLAPWAHLPAHPYNCPLPTHYRHSLSTLAASSPHTTGTPQHLGHLPAHPHRGPPPTHPSHSLSTLRTPLSTTLLPLPTHTIATPTAHKEHLTAHPYSCPLPTHHRHTLSTIGTPPITTLLLPLPTHTIGTPQHTRNTSQHTPAPSPHTTVDATKKPLQQPYDGPFTVIKRTRKNVTIDRHGKSDVIAIDRVKPAYLLQPDPSPTNTVC